MLYCWSQPHVELNFLPLVTALCAFRSSQLKLRDWVSSSLRALKFYHFSLWPSLHFIGSVRTSGLFFYLRLGLDPIRRHQTTVLFCCHERKGLSWLRYNYLLELGQLHVTERCFMIRFFLDAADRSRLSTYWLVLLVNKLILFAIIKSDSINIIIF